MVEAGAPNPSSSNTQPFSVTLILSSSQHEFLGTSDLLPHGALVFRKRKHSPDLLHKFQCLVQGILPALRDEVGCVRQFQIETRVLLTKGLRWFRARSRV